MFEIDARSKAIGIITGCRVKALEDAGLAIIDKTELSELQSLAQAKADGRLKISPAKPGDIIYRPEALQFCWVITNPGGRAK